MLYEATENEEVKKFLKVAAVDRMGKNAATI